MRILVTGSRDWTDRSTIRFALREAFVEFGRDRNIILVHGAARGADRIAADIWKTQGLLDEPHPALWKQYGNGAGMIRNREMVALGAALCLAFPLPSSIGTFGCMREAEKAGIPVRKFDHGHYDLL